MSVDHPASAVVAAVIVVVNGMVVPSAPPAVVREGRVIAPLALVARFADRVDTAAGGTVTVARGALTCGAHADERNGANVVELAPVARCLGARVAWDGPTKTLVLTFGGERIVRTPAPYDPNAPRVAPTTVFTPEPASPTPRVIATGAPRPRRTPVPAIPSWPLVTATPSSSPASSAPTTPRP